VPSCCTRSLATGHDGVMPGTFLYPSFKRLPWVDRASAFNLLATLLDFDNSDRAWKK
jgi:hypothetical protein